MIAPLCIERSDRSRLASAASMAVVAGEAAVVAAGVTAEGALPVSAQAESWQIASAKTAEPTAARQASRGRRRGSMTGAADIAQGLQLSLEPRHLLLVRGPPQRVLVLLPGLLGAA